MVRALTSPPLDPPEGEHCTMVNPLCPDDLCILAYGHEGRHLLGTDAWSTPNAQRVQGKFFSRTLPKGTPKNKLIRAGAEWQDELFPEEARR